MSSRSKDIAWTRTLINGIINIWITLDEIWPSVMWPKFSSEQDMGSYVLNIISDKNFEQIKGNVHGRLIYAYYVHYKQQAHIYTQWK